MRAPENPDQPGTIKTIANAQDLEVVCSLPRAIIYIIVSSSEYEQASRDVVYQALEQIDCKGTPVFTIDCTTQQQEYFENWLIAQTQHVHLFYTGGYGETLLVQQGEVRDFINYPARLGTEKTRAIIENWLLQDQDGPR